MESDYLAKIPQVEESEFNRVHAIIKEIGEEERHFNNLSSKYKTMTSTWLLSTFAGIGFILINNIEPVYLFVSGICFAGGIGIFLLWLTDLKVYQQLLAANFVEGLKLEKEYDWLPRIRQNMIDSQLTGTVITHLSWFYILGMIIPLLIGAFSLSRFIISISLLGTIITALGFTIFLVFLTRSLISKSEESSLKEFLEKKEKIPISIKNIFWIYGIIILIGFGLFNLTEIMKLTNDPESGEIKTELLPETYDYLAPDSSEIRLLTELNNGGMAHCILPPGKVSKAVMHKTVEEIWYVLQGQGNIWRKNEQEEVITDLKSGVSITIPIGTKFQFRNTGDTPLEIIITTMPPWPGEDEAVFVEGHW